VYFESEITVFAATHTLNVYININIHVPIPVPARSKAWVCVRSIAGIWGLNAAEGRGCLSVVSDVCCQVEVLLSG
jgi:hypothetical protein